MKLNIVALLVRYVFLPCLNHPGNGTGTLWKFNFNRRSLETLMQRVKSGTLDILGSSLKIIRWPFLFKEINPSPHDLIHVLSTSSGFRFVFICLNLWSSSGCNILAVDDFLGVLVFSRSRSASETLGVNWEAGRIVGKGFMLQNKRCWWLFFFTKWLTKCF